MRRADPDRACGTSCAPSGSSRPTPRRPPDGTDRTMATTVDAHQHFWDPARATYPFLTDELAAIRRRFGPDDLATAPGRDRDRSDHRRPDPERPRRDSRVPRDRGGDPVHRRGRRLGRPHGSGHRRHARRAPVGARRRPARRDPPSGPRRAGSRPGSPDPMSVGASRPSARPGSPTTCSSAPVSCRRPGARRRPCRTCASSSTTSPSHRSASGALQPWADLLRPFGALPNVVVQGLRPRHRGRLGDRAAGATSCRTSRHALEVFGPDRLLFGSDWPVCLLAASYEEVVASVPVRPGRPERTRDGSRLRPHRGGGVPTLIRPPGAAAGGDRTGRRPASAGRR